MKGAPSPSSASPVIASLPTSLSERQFEPFSRCFHFLNLVVLLFQTAQRRNIPSKPEKGGQGACPAAQRGPGQPAGEGASLPCRSLRISGIAPASLSAPCIALALSLRRHGGRGGDRSPPARRTRQRQNRCQAAALHKQGLVAELRRIRLVLGPSSNIGDGAALPRSCVTFVPRCYRPVASHFATCITLVLSVSTAG